MIKRELPDNISEYLYDKFNVLGHFNLLHHDSAMNGLVALLKEVSPAVWKINDLIIIEHFDTEFFPVGYSVGNTSYNLFKCIQEAGIPLDKILIVTATMRMRDQYLTMCQQFISDPIPTRLRVFECLTGKLQWYPTTTSVGAVPEFNYLSMSHVERMHRTIMMSHLVSNHPKSGIIAYNRNLIPSHTEESNQYFETLPEFDQKSVTVSPLLTTSPFSRFRNSWKVSEYCQKLYDLNVPQYLDKKHKIHSDMTRFKDKSVYERCLVDIVLETAFDYPYPYITEKTMRPLGTGNPFVIVGPAGMLQYLHEIGFKTFSNWWDETYDMISDPNARMHELIKLSSHIAKLPISRCKQMKMDMAPILQHNADLYARLPEKELVRIKSML